MTFTLQEDLPLTQAAKLFFPDSSNRTLQNWIKGGRICVDGKPLQRGDILVKKGQVLTLDDKLPIYIEGIPIIYQDRWMIVIQKPEGLLSVPADKDEHNVMHLLKFGLKTQAILPVHRLDQGSSGVLVFARNPLAEKKLNELFAKHDLIREYIAIVEGRLPKNKGTWVSYLREKENFDVEVTTEDLGKKAITHFEMIYCSKKFSYLKLTLETGKKHQIRVQASEIGHPIVGDRRYKSLINPFKRLCLHAHRLEFVHPFTGKRMVFTTLDKHVPNFIKPILKRISFS